MSTALVISVFILSYFIRMYSMKHMTLKQPKGKIYYSWSYPLLLSTFSICYFGSFVEYFLVTVRYGFNLNIIGLLVLWLGIAVTARSIWLVGGSWSQQIEIKKKHKLCEKGLYRIMRNPYYAGVFLELLGACLFYNGYYALLFLIFVHMPLVIYRAVLEENVLRKHLKGYVQYVRKVWLPL